MIEQVLQNIGLTQNEIKVYLALLNLGESKTGEILNKAGLNSGKIYEILDSLQKKGLVSFVVRSGIKYFSPANPKRVLDYLDEKRKNIIKQEESYKEILPNLLKQISLKAKEPKIEIFTGYKGMKTAYKKELNFSKGTKLYVFGICSSENYDKKFWDFFVQEHQPKRHLQQYEVKKLVDEKSRKNIKEHDKKAKIKYLPYGSLSSTNVIGNLTTIGIFSDNPIIISIEDKEVAKSFQEQFDLLWKIAKK